MSPDSAFADHKVILANHAAQLSQQSHHAHESLEYQFSESPLGIPMCQLSRQLEDMARKLEHELLVSCSTNRARHLVNIMDRRFHALEQVYGVALHRANVGIDPPVGCTLAIDRLLAQMSETLHCLKDEVENYRPVRYERPRSTCPSRYSEPVHAAHSSYSRRAPSHSRYGVSIQRGSFRFSFGG